MRLWIRPWPRYTAQRLFRVDRRFRTAVRPSERVKAVAEAFGLGIDEERVFTVFEDFQLDIEPGKILLITGESGGGKSLLLRAIAAEMEGLEEFRPVADASRIRIVQERPIVETLGKDVTDAIEKLSMAGLNEAYLFLRRFDELSDGQKYRYRIARLLDSRARTWVLDEFTSVLDRTTARVVAYCLQKAARRRGVTVLAATTHEDIAEDLNPDVIVRKGFGPAVSVEYLSPSPKPCSLLGEAVVERGDMRDYGTLRHLHYKPGKIFGVRAVYRARIRGDLAGVIVYSAPLLMLSARFKALPFLRKKLRELGSMGEWARLVNSLFTRIARVIIHPKYRSIGLGVKLVKETLPLAGTPYVETLAVMARYNPFFEKAGMVRVDTPPPRDIFFERLEALGVNPEAVHSWMSALRILEKLPRRVLLEVRGLCLERLERLKAARIKSRSGLMMRLRRGLDLEAMARVVAMRPLHTVYLVWRKRDRMDLPEPFASEA
ncbi:MAG: hypothetical protein QXQ48_07370 [Nitrososphaerota archaeon]